VKAVFLMRECVLPGRATQVDREAARRGLQALAQTELFTILLDTDPDTPSPSPGWAARVAAIIETAGGRVDAVAWCPHPKGHGCGCWGARPGLILEALARYDLEANECYLIGSSQADVEMAATAGVRPVMLLQGRTIGDILGDGCQHKDFPIARELSQAVEYLQAEEDSTAQLGRPRQIAALAPVEESSHPAVGTPVLTPISRLAVSAGRRTRLRPREALRWLSFFILGGVWLSLGIAYLLTQLYRVQPFPEFVWFVTLQFIPRVARGALFILTGVAVVLLASRSFFRSVSNGQGSLRRR